MAVEAQAMVAEGVGFEEFQLVVVGVGGGGGRVGICRGGR